MCTFLSFTQSLSSSGLHPHDTIPLYTSDIFRKKSGSNDGSSTKKQTISQLEEYRLQNKLGVQTHVKRGASGALDAAVKNAEDRARSLLWLEHGEI
jgi:hypothetical protein